MNTFDPYYKWLGIPPKDQPPNHYRLLGVELWESDLDVISSAADQRMSHIRSFQAGKHSALSQKILNEISSARICLLNAGKKAEYDTELKEKQSPVVLPKPAQPKITPKDIRQVVISNNSTPIPDLGFIPIPTVSKPASNKNRFWLIVALCTIVLFVVAVLASRRPDTPKTAEKKSEFIASKKSKLEPKPEIKLEPKPEIKLEPKPEIKLDPKSQATTGKEISIDLGNGVRLAMVPIPAGEFIMGDNNSGSTPAHKVRITKGFYLGKYEVTQEQWQAVMGNNPSAFQGPRNPVELVSWGDSQKFLDKLTAKYGRSVGGKFVLPTEAQWEYACRAGSISAFYFGDDEKQLGEYAWYGNNSESKTHPVGGKKPNGWGLYDMHGNVLEWCQDWYDNKHEYYANSPIDDPPGPASGRYRIRRGGCWKVAAARCSSAAFHAVPNEYEGADRFHDLGLRVALLK